MSLRSHANKNLISQRTIRENARQMVLFDGTDQDWPTIPLHDTFNGQASITSRFDGILQLVAPFFHADGDMYDICIDTDESCRKRK